MNVPFVDPAGIAIPIELRSCFDRQRAAYFADPEPSYAQRIANLKSLAALLKENREALVAAISGDYGNRSSSETLFAEFFVVLESIKDTSKQLKKWMKPQRRRIDFLTYPGARNRVIPQPLGVVGVIVPWNFPVDLSFLPLTAIFAAGNRAMIKMSENSQRLAVVLMNISPKYFPEDKLKFFDDGMSRIPRATIVRTMTLENPGRLAIGMSGAHIEGASRVGLTPSPTCQTRARWFPARGWGQIGNETGHANCQPSSDQTHGGIFYV